MKKEKVKLTPMQEFALAFLKKEEREVNPSQVGYEWNVHTGKPNRSASRDMFGTTSAAYRTLRKLCEMGLVTKHVTTYSEWYSYKNQ